MDVPESHKYLLDSQVATLATVDRDGYPQQTEIWFLADGDSVKLSLNATRHKTRNLSERPECSLFILDLEKPFRYLEIRGRAKIDPDDDYVFADKVGAKYDGADLRNMDQPGESRVVVTLEPVKVHAVDMSAH
jgi:PPOX class probable F420-dependent enzyme